jgi:hypothetical protein
MPCYAMKEKVDAQVAIKDAPKRLYHNYLRIYTNIIFDQNIA